MKKINKYFSAGCKNPILLIFISFLVLSGCSPMDGERELVAKRLKDPESVKFRNEKRYKNGYVCGEFNSKNSYGAYVGYSGYIAKMPDVCYTEEGGCGKLDLENFGLFLEDVKNKEKTAFKKIWNKYCN